MTERGRDAGCGGANPRDEAATEVGRRLRGSVLASIGYLLSPLSWWNDFLVNIPLAYVFALGVGWLCPRLFSAAMVVGYWGTNLAGLWLLHAGTVGALGGRRGRSRRRDLAIHVAVSSAYTAIILALMYTRVIRFPGKGFGR